jgi:hypothetical protein
MSENQSNAKDWQSCPQGEMGRLVAGLRGKRRTRQSIVIGGTAAAVVVVLMLGNLGISMMQNPGIAGLTCQQVASMAGDYVEGKLDLDQTEQVRLHAEKCGHCRAEIAKLRKAKADGDVAAHRLRLFRHHASRTFAAL